MAHALGAGGFALLAVALSYPLILDPASQIPGGGPGDNVTFLWNFWWFRFAWEHTGLSFFHTPYLFAPFGTSLVLHTHTALQAFAGGTLLRGLAPVTAHNVVLLAGLTANGVATYALAFYHVRRILPAVLAGVVFASSAYLAIRLLGHFNLVHAWVIPLAALAWIAWTHRPTPARAAAVAVAFGAASYSDYYYLTYCVLFAAGWWLLQGRRIEIRWSARRFPRLDRVLLALMLLIAAAVVGILVTGGVQMEVGPWRLSASHTRNPLAGLWLLALVWLGLRVRPVVTGEPASRRAPLRERLPALTLALVLYAVIILPLAGPALALLRSGHYVAPRHGWQSGPRGVDFATFALGNPLHPLYGTATRGVYERAGIDMMEQTAWLGIVPLLMAGIAWSTRSAVHPSAHQWLWIGAGFLVWSAGSFLVLGGLDTGLPLPQALVRYVPLLSNARMPGRAIVMVQLAAAVLCAMVVARREWQSGAIGAAILVAIVDGAAAPFPMYRLPPPTAVDALLRADGRYGSVMEIPAGLRDGLGTTGHVDHRSFVYQMTHQRPLVGGFVARLAPELRDRYAGSAALMSLIQIPDTADAGSGTALPAGLADELRAHGVRFIVVNTDIVPQSLGPALEERGVRFVLRDASRELYEVAEGNERPGRR